MTVSKDLLMTVSKDLLMTVSKDFLMTVSKDLLMTARPFWAQHPYSTVFGEQQTDYEQQADYQRADYEPEPDYQRAGEPDYQRGEQPETDYQRGEQPDYRADVKHSSTVIVDMCNKIDNIVPMDRVEAQLALNVEAIREITTVSNSLINYLLFFCHLIPSLQVGRFNNMVFRYTETTEEVIHLLTSVVYGLPPVYQI
ncbi:hypothetical protein ACOMHN_011790 [Nucella lapillus]